MTMLGKVSREEKREKKSKYNLGIDNTIRKEN
jgi:hypothetical protein